MSDEDLVRDVRAQVDDLNRATAAALREGISTYLSHSQESVEDGTTQGKSRTIVEFHSAYKGIKTE